VILLIDFQSVLDSPRHAGKEVILTLPEFFGEINISSSFTAEYAENAEASENQSGD